MISSKHAWGTWHHMAIEIFLANCLLTMELICFLIFVLLLTIFVHSVHFVQVVDFAGLEQYCWMLPCPEGLDSP